MRKCLASFSALALFASPFFFAYCEAGRALRWRDAVYRCFDPSLPLLMILYSFVITFALPWIVGLLYPEEQQD